MIWGSMFIMFQLEKSEIYLYLRIFENRWSEPTLANFEKISKCRISFVDSKLHEVAINKEWSVNF
jgi:hypothetical protein